MNIDSKGLGYSAMLFDDAHAEIQHNINVLVHSTEVRIKVDVGYYAIFRQALKELESIAPDRTTLHATQQLSQQLESLISKIQGPVHSFFTDDLVSACHGPMLPSVGIEGDSCDPWHDILNQMDQVCDLIKIRGNGHCLFSAMAVGLLCKYCGDHRAVVREKIQCFREAPFGAQISPIVWKKIVDSLGQCDTPQGVVGVMSDFGVSQAWIILMRRLAEIRLREKILDPEYKTHIEYELRESGIFIPIDDYLKNVGNIDARQWGGEPERVALSEVFENLFECFSFKSQNLERLFQHPDGVYLLFNGTDHYDLVLPKERR